MKLERYVHYIIEVSIPLLSLSSLSVRSFSSFSILRCTFLSNIRSLRRSSIRFFRASSKRFWNSFIFSCKEKVVLYKLRRINPTRSSQTSLQLLTCSAQEKERIHRRLSRRFTFTFLLSTMCIFCTNSTNKLLAHRQPSKMFVRETQLWKCF